MQSSNPFGWAKWITLTIAAFTSLVLSLFFIGLFQTNLSYRKSRNYP